MAETKRQVCSKEQYLKAAIPVLKNFGVVFKEDGRTVQSKQKYWDLLRLVNGLNVAITAASGANVSLSGVGVYRFSEAGRTDESRSLRFKSKVSSSTARVIKEHQEIISTTPRLMGDPQFNEEEFLSAVVDCLDALGLTFNTNKTSEVVECNDEGLI